MKWGIFVISVLFLVACSKKDPTQTGNDLLPQKVQSQLKDYEQTSDSQEESVPEELNQLLSVPEPELYVNELYGFETLKPEGWEQQNDRMGTLVVFVEPKREGDTFQSNINIIAQVLTREFENLTLDDYIANSVKEIKPFFDSFEILDKKSSKFGGDDSRVVTYRVSKGDQTLKLIQRIVKHKHTIFVITYTSTEKEYDRFFDKFKVVENSFRFRD